MQSSGRGRDLDNLSPDHTEALAVDNTEDQIKVPI